MPIDESDYLLTVRPSAHASQKYFTRFVLKAEWSHWRLRKKKVRVLMYSDCRLLKSILGRNIALFSESFGASRGQVPLPADSLLPLLKRRCPAFPFLPVFLELSLNWCPRPQTEDRSSSGRQTYFLVFSSMWSAWPEGLLSDLWKQAESLREGWKKEAWARRQKSTFRDKQTLMLVIRVIFHFKVLLNMICITI